jgi:hypothetical protein
VLKRRAFSTFPDGTSEPGTEIRSVSGNPQALRPRRSELHGSFALKDAAEDDNGWCQHASLIPRLAKTLG